MQKRVLIASAFGLLSLSASAEVYIFSSISQPGATSTNGLGVNNAGVATGSSSYASPTVDSGWVWNGAHTNFRVNLGSGDLRSLARSINDAGVTVGRMTFSTAFADEAAFVYRPGDASITSLGFFGTTRTEAIDINDNGWIVGYAGNTEGDSSPVNRAILWLPDANGTAGYQAYDLNTLFTLGSVATGDWTRLLEARAINDDNTIVGYGRFVATPGGAEVTKGFVMVVPEPASLSLLAGAGLLALRQRSPRLQ